MFPGGEAWRGESVPSDDFDMLTVPTSQLIFPIDSNFSLLFEYFCHLICCQMFMTIKIGNDTLVWFIRMVSGWLNIFHKLRHYLDDMSLYRSN